MAEATMPATEAAAAASSEEERSSYELAFHILPTVAEGEVPGVFDALKTLITNHGGESFDEEAPERIDLAFDIVRQSEGKNRKYHSAYFGWVRFRIDGEHLSGLKAEIESDSNILRFLIVKLTKTEEANPFRFHEARKQTKQVETIEEKPVLSEADAEKARAPKEVSQSELDDSLEKIAGDEDVSSEDDQSTANTTKDEPSDSDDDEAKTR